MGAETAADAGVPHRPAIDGVRALAVLAVVLYHADVSWIPAGFLGVDVFFVISGYLICSLLLAEWDATGGLSLGRFWRRRARRLLPAVVAMVLLVATFTALAVPGAAHRLWDDLGGVALYASNWWQVLHHQSYFESFGRPSPVQHLWSLGVEEQFYVGFPLLLAVVLPWAGHHRRVLALAAGATGVASTVAMAVLWQPGVDPSRVWFGTDTRAVGLCAGVALAFVLAPHRLEAALVGRRAVAILDGAGAIGLCTLALLMTRLDEFGSALYRGGFAACALASGLVVLAAAHPATRLGTVLAWRPARWLGTRSYAVYLWHWPVIVLTRPHLDVPLHGMPLLVLRLALTAGLAELSWRAVEQPFRTGTAQAWWRRRTPVDRTRWALAITTAATVLIAGVAGAAADHPPTTLATAMARPGGGADRLLSLSTPSTTTSTSTSTTTTVPATVPTTVLATSSLVSATAPAPVPEPPAATPPAPPAGSVLAIGDSVLAASARALTAASNGHVVVDAVVGRQTWEGLDLLERYRDQGRLRQVSALVWALGTNGPLSASQLEQLALVSTGVPRVVVVNVRVPKRWEAETNTSIGDGVPKHGRMRLADWHAVSGAGGVIGDDGVHPTPPGARLFARVVLEQLQDLSAPTPTTAPPAPAPAPPPPPASGPATTQPAASDPNDPSLASSGR
ncbi:MAG: acyltransferase [Acidobacteria bacterium]|nr:acyltransferase [Acidobacteriota bacterium]